MKYTINAGQQALEACRSSGHLVHPIVPICGGAQSREKAVDDAEGLRGQGAVPLRSWAAFVIQNRGMRGHPARAVRVANERRQRSRHDSPLQDDAVGTADLGVKRRPVENLRVSQRLEGRVVPLEVTAQPQQPQRAGWGQEDVILDKGCAAAKGPVQAALHVWVELEDLQPDRRRQVREGV